MLKSLLDVNLPKFVSEDIPLFRGILRDMFPGVKPPEVGREQLLEALREKCAESNLQPTQWFLEKVLQLYEMVLFRHGIMLIGDPMSGKTQSYTILSEALTSLAEKGVAEYKTTFKVINPKSITMAELYGTFDSSTHEWTDGVLGRTFREMATAATEERRWIVFDGPVDSAWIENLNTVLDDSKKLCLMNGEIIPLTRPWMGIFFEMSDLKKVSPSVVGRSGIAYLESRKLGWTALKKSFVESLPNRTFDQEKIDLLDDLFDWLVPPVLSKIKQQSGLFLPYMELHLVKCQLSLLSSLLGVTSAATGGRRKAGAGGGGKDAASSSSSTSESKDSGGQQHQEIDSTHMQMAFLFSVLWGICCTLPEQARYDWYITGIWARLSYTLAWQRDTHMCSIFQ